MKKGLLFFVVMLFQSSLKAGPTVEQSLMGQGLDVQKAASSLVMDVAVQSVTDTAETRKAGYFESGDHGEWTDTTLRKVKAECTVLSIDKNKAKRALKKNGTVTIIFWRQIEGKLPDPNSGIYRDHSQRVPEKGARLKVLFKDGLKKNDELLPWFVYNLDNLPK